MEKYGGIGESEFLVEKDGSDVLFKAGQCGLASEEVEVAEECTERVGVELRRGLQTRAKAFCNASSAVFDNGGREFSCWSEEVDKRVIQRTVGAEVRLNAIWRRKTLA